MEVWTASQIILVLNVFLSTNNADLSDSVLTYSKDTRDRADRDAVDIFHHTYEAGYFCFEENCRCSDDKADCSQNAGNLSFIPRLPGNIRFLNFSYNDVKAVQNESFFLNVTNITGLDLGHNGLTYIGPDAFRLLTKLRFLSLSYNRDLNNSALPAVLSINSLRKLDFRFGNLGPLPDDIFYTHSLPELHDLVVHSNHIKHVNLSAFSSLGILQKLGLRSNYISYALPGHLNQIHTLNMARNEITEFPVTCSANGSSFFPRLRQLFLDGNILQIVSGDVCLPRLRLLDLSDNVFKSFHIEVLNVYKFPSLTELYLKYMNMHVQAIGRYAFQNPVLQTIVLMYNNLDFGEEQVDPDCFAGCPNLNDLQLSHNYFSNINNKKWSRLLANLSRVQYLYVENAQIRQFPAPFAKLVYLKKLTLSQNNIRSIPDGAFDRLTELKTLQLDNNQISVIRETTFSASTRQRLSHLDLSGNPFTCSCDIMWFRQWLVSEPKLFDHSWTTYQCDNIAETNVTSFYMADQACLLNRDTYTFIAVSVAMLISTLTLVSLLIRYRWHIRLVLYEAFRGRGEYRLRRLQQEHFQYDVFVSYASEDLQWVREHLMPELEGRLGLRLCIHERDFIPGHPIVDNIEESVQTSKKVMMVFSSHFAHSQWCQFELRLCLSHVMEHDDALLVVLLHDVPAHDMTSTMMAVLKTTTYIEWGDEPDAVASFWGRIQIALNEVLPVAALEGP